MLRFISAVMGALFINYILCWYCLEANDYAFSDVDVLSRQKRQYLPLVFPVAGVFKLIFGFGIPIKNPANISLGFGCNMQFQYPVPTNISFFNKYLTYATIARKKRSKEDKLKQYEKERYKIFNSLEESMDRLGINGKECLLRTICEAAESPIEHDGYFGQLIHLILTPKENQFYNQIMNVEDNEYVSAMQAGENLYDCRKLYPKCPIGHGLFDLISVFE